MLVSHSGSDLCAAVPFLVELVVKIIIIVLVRFRLSVVSGRIHYVGQPGDEITGDLSILYAVHQVTWQSVVHHPRDEVTIIGGSGVGEDVAQGSEYPVHGIFQIIVDQTGADADSVLAAVREHLFTQPYNEQKDGLVAALIKGGAHKADGKKLTPCLWSAVWRSSLPR